VTPAARLTGAIEILTEVEVRHRPVSEALRDWGHAHRFAGVKDRAAIGNLVYDALRKKASLAWAMGSDDARALILAVFARHWGVGAARMTELMANDRHAPSPLSEEEAQRLDAPPPADMPDHVRADIPEWLASRFAAGLGSTWPDEGEHFAMRPPLDLRVNRLKADRAKAGRELARFGASETRLSPDGLRIPPTVGAARHPNLEVEPAWQKGWVEVQDEGSQIAALLVAASASEQVLDLCAGGGGKTLALAAAMENRGQIHATDDDRNRLAPIFARLKRAGTRNVQVHRAGSDLAALEGRMDRVLVDAPCSGSGTWRRRPEIKWRLSERALAQRQREQEQILDRAAAFVRAGGTLCYVTCSVLPEENAGAVSTFLERHPSFSALSPSDSVRAAGLPEGLLEAAAVSPQGLQLTPRRSETDGFFIAVLRRGG
jgi:16S rRNA (cytosine967-C5)-methyltransferase